MDNDELKAQARKELLRRQAVAELESRKSAAPQEEAEAPWYQKAGQAADDMVRLAASGMTFGFADKLAGAMSGEGTEGERQRTQQARERAGSAGNVAEIGGAVAVPLGLASKGATLAGRLGTGAMTGGKGLAARSGLMAAEGAGYGALTALGNDQDVGEGAAYGAAGGILGNVAGEAISSGVSKVAGAFNKKPKIPQLDEIRTAAKAAYDKADEAGVIFNPQGIQRLSSEVKGKLTDFGYDPALQPRIKAVLSRLDDLSEGNVTLKGMDTLRKVANNARMSMDPSEQMIGGRVIESLDDFIENVKPGEVLAGDATKGSAALKEARELWSRVRKTETVEKALEGAKLDTSASGSGGNIDNRTRQVLKPILKKTKGLKPDEKAALEKVIKGTPTQNALRLAGKLSPSGNGLMTMLHLLGGSATSGATLPLAAAGYGAKAAADNMTDKNVQQLVKVLLAGGDASATKAAPNAIQRLSQSKREALARSLMSIGAFEAGTPAR